MTAKSGWKTGWLTVCGSPGRTVLTLNIMTWTASGSSGVRASLVSLWPTSWAEAANDWLHQRSLPDPAQGTARVARAACLPPGPIILRRARTVRPVVLGPSKL
mmetsp:Transcript_126327/g.205240  ORF Transcript_126327/g.205240 Transcript_126327/m.205240 type:complete len:103 (+) Transcript_126327:534-842(+)